MQSPRCTVRGGIAEEQQERKFAKYNFKRMARDATASGDSEILTFIMALQCFVSFILARAWIEGTIPGIGLVGGVIVYVCCIGYGCGKVADKLEDRRNKKEMDAVKKQRQKRLPNPYTDRPVVAY